VILREEEEEGQGESGHANGRGVQEPGEPRRLRQEGLLVERVTADPGDLYSLGDLLHLSFKEDGYQATEETLYLALCELLEAIYSGVSTVWRAAGSLQGDRPLPVGMIEVRRMDVPPFGPHYLLSRLVVLPDYRGGRVALALIRHALAGMTEDVPILAMTLGKQIPRSYRRLGAVPIGQVAAGSVAEVRRRLSRWEERRDRS
jgi:GNAT superfamily N-acetyltransferase